MNRNRRATAFLIASVALLQLPTTGGPARAQVAEGEADLELVLTDAPDPVQVNDDITYTGTVTNHGPGAASFTSSFGVTVEGVTLNSLLSPATRYKSSQVAPSGPGRSCGLATVPTIVSCGLGGLAPGEEVTVTITVTAIAPGQVANSTVVFHQGSAIDLNPSNNQATTLTLVTGLPVPEPDLAGGSDLAVTIDDQPDPVQRSGDILYMITVRNKGPLSLVGNVEMQGFVAATTSSYRGFSASKGSCKDANFASSTRPATTEFRCLLPNGLENGETATFFVVVGAPDRDETVKTSVTVRGTAANPPNPDPPADNVDSTTTTVGDGIPDPPEDVDTPPLPGTTDLAVSMTDSPDPVTIAEDLTYTITVTNVGSAAPEPSVMTLRFRSGTVDENRGSMSSQSPANQCGFGFGFVAGVVICQVGPLAAGQSIVFTIILSVADSPMWAVAVVQAKDSTQESDANQTNNYAIETTNVGSGPGAPGEANLSIGMEDDPDPVKATRELTYTLTARNHGPEEASGVTVTDLLPAGVAFRSASSGCAFEENSRTVTCRLATLGADATSSWAVLVIPERGATLSNAANVTGSAVDPDISDNQVSESTTVEPAADLLLFSSASPSKARVGEEVTYTMTVPNQGPDRAEAVSLVATLPRSLAYRSSSRGCSLEVTSSTVNCALGDREAGESVDVEIRAVPAKPGQITSTARLETRTFDPDTSDNETSIAVEASCFPISLPGPGQIAYPSGWSIIGLPGGTRAPADSKLYGWFNRNDEDDYSRTDQGDPVASGHGYWARFACPRLVDVGTGSPTARFPLGAYRASMVGNPSGTLPVTVSGHDFAAFWDRSLNSGAGGYHSSEYREPIALAPGEGAWIFAYDSTEIRIEG